MVIPPSLRAWADLGNEAVIVGNLNHAEMWSPARWEDYRRDMESADALAQHLTGLGI